MTRNRGVKTVTHTTRSTKQSPVLLCTALAGVVLLAAAQAQEHTDTRAGEGEAHEEEIVRLSAAELREFGVEVRRAEGGSLEVYLTLPGEVVPDPDRIAHVVPRVPGVARQVHHAIGDVVRAGDTLAVLDSRELSQMKSQYLVARERTALAQSTFEREENLWRDKVSSERAYLTARQGLAEERIEMRAAKQTLHAIGFSDNYIEDLTFRVDTSFLSYPMRAPFGGVIVEKHLALGEFVGAEESAFVVADLSVVWVELSVYQKDLPRVRVGQRVRVVDTQAGTEAEGRISYISPILGEETRTGTARLVLANDGAWRPGLFIEGGVVVDSRPVEVMVPKGALQTFEGRTVVFAQTEKGFEPIPVELGLENDTHVELLTGLATGQRYAATGSFILKAQLEKSSFASGHQH